MNAPSLLWTIGAGGLLGSAVVRATAHRRRRFDPGAIGWTAPNVLREVAEACRQFRREAADGDWAIAWCAGAGIIGTSDEALEHETHLLKTVLDMAPANGGGTIFLASSAGGTYGGTHDVPITESSPTAPLSAYGRNKLRQEQLVSSWADERGERAVIGRISNIYGPGQSLHKRQGLITHLCHASLTRQPITIYVSLDTIRDYIYVDDCARLIIESIDRAASLSRGRGVIKILASSRSISVGALLAETRRVIGRRPTVVMIPSTNTSAQGSVLSFCSTVWDDLDRRVQTSLPDGIARTTEHLRRQLSNNGLQPMSIDDI